jgi:hypothetical protein
MGRSNDALVLQILLLVVLGILMGAGILLLLPYFF